MPIPSADSFSATGTDSFTPPPTLTFAPGTSVIAGAVGGTFASFLTDGNPITFAAGRHSMYRGDNTPPPIQLFSTTEAGETFGFTVSSFVPGPNPRMGQRGLPYRRQYLPHDHGNGNVYRERGRWPTRRRQLEFQFNFSICSRPAFGHAHIVLRVGFGDSSPGCS